MNDLLELMAQLQHEIEIRESLLSPGMLSCLNAVISKVTDIGREELCEQLRKSELHKAEHEARCDLIDALGLLEIMWGGYGDNKVTASEKTIANEFWRKMKAKYPQQKGPYGQPPTTSQHDEADAAQTRKVT